MFVCMCPTAVLTWCTQICLRGPGMCAGYHKQPELWACSIDTDGFFHTGVLKGLSGGWSGLLPLLLLHSPVTCLLLSQQVELASLHAPWTLPSTTGDVGELTPQGALRIIGKKKDIIKLATGESPE